VCVEGISSDAWYYYTSSLFRAKDATGARYFSQAGGTAKTKRCPSHKTASLQKNPKRFN
jgi:hypothetical protein